MGDALLLQGKEADGRDSIATQLAEYSHWDDLVIIIAVVNFSAFLFLTSWTNRNELVVLKFAVSRRLAPLLSLTYMMW